MHGVSWALLIKRKQNNKLINLSVCLSVCPSIYRSIDLSIYRSIYLSRLISSHLISSHLTSSDLISSHLSIYQSISESIYFSIPPSIDRSIHPSIDPSIHRSIDSQMLRAPLDQTQRILQLYIIYTFMCLFGLFPTLQTDDRHANQMERSAKRKRVLKGHQKYVYIYIL